MHWNEIRPAIKTLIGSISELTTVWEDEPRPFEWSQGNVAAICLLKITNVVDIGTGEIRTVKVGDVLKDEHRADKLFTLTIKAQSAIQTDDGSAYQYLELIRAKLKFKGSEAALLAVNCSISQLLQTVDLSFTSDDRWRSTAALDVIMNAKGVIVDPVGYPYIAGVEAQGEGDIAGTIIIPP